MTEKEIKDRYKALHNELTQRYYGKKELTKAEFDLQHENIWVSMRTELIAGEYLQEPTPPRDLISEIDSLSERMAELEQELTS